MIKSFLAARLPFFFAALWLAVAIGSARGQIINPNAVSDTVKVSVNGLTPPLAQLDISESQEDGQFRTLAVPGTVIQLIEPGVAGGTQISDRLIIDPFQILFASDSENPLAPRPNATKTTENFSPLQIRFASDVEGVASNFSDFVDVIINGALAQHRELLELPTAGEPPIDIILEPADYDMYEGGTAAGNAVSDYLHISQVHLNFVSDSTEQGLPILDPIPGYALLTLPETDALGGSLVHVFDVSASSDGDVPEPASVTLLAISVIALAGCVRRRKPLA